MNTAVVTTGTRPLTVGSDETFVAQAVANGLPWDLRGGSADLILADPSGNETTITATVGNGYASADWTVTTPIGEWTRAWRLQDASGRNQYSQPIIFSVISSPA